MSALTPLADKVAVVTGGNQGIGRAIALEMARAGAAVVIAARTYESLDEVRRELETLGATSLALRCDVADPASVDAIGDTVLSRFGRVDVVVANAGVAGPTKPLHEISPQEWRECMATDLDGVYLTFRRFVPAMLERRSGVLIAISSMTGKRPLLNRTPYAAAKMGVIGLVRTLALELGPYGIRANCVCPGAVEGARIAAVIRAQGIAQGISEAEVAKQLTEGAPLQRMVGPQEIASTCVFLASEAAAAITGEDVNVSAGLVMY